MFQVGKKKIWKGVNGKYTLLGPQQKLLYEKNITEKIAAGLMS